MSGPNSPRGLQPPQGHSTSRGRLWALGSSFALALCVSHCGFPSYSFTQAAAGAGGSVNGGSSGAGAGGSQSGTGGGDNAGGDSGVSGMGADAGSAGAAGAACVYPTPVKYPSHCFDQALGNGETGIDCGGAECLPCDGTQTCVQNQDCASGSCPAAKACSPVLALQYMSIVNDAVTRTPKFHLIITYQDTKQVPLSSLTIRYYFSHNGVSEPVIALDTQGNLQTGNTQSDIATSARWLVHHFPPGPPDQNTRTTDSYLEISFTSPLVLVPGSKLDLTQDIVNGNSDTSFDQNSHYSFVSTTAWIANEAITVYRKDDTGEPQRVWGVAPPMTLLPDCAFAGGVNLNGGMLTVDGRPLAASAGRVQFAGPVYASTALKPFPSSDAATATLLSTAFTLNDSFGASWAAPSGKYWAYAWLTAAASADAGTLSLQGNAADKFYGTQKAMSSEWSLIGPYSLTINEADGALLLTSAGKTNVAGLMLYAQP